MSVPVLLHRVGVYCSSSESLKSLREHRLLFNVLPVPASVRPAGHVTAVFT